MKNIIMIQNKYVTNAIIAQLGLQGEENTLLHFGLEVERIELGALMSVTIPSITNGVMVPHIGPSAFLQAEGFPSHTIALPHLESLDPRAFAASDIKSIDLSDAPLTIIDVEAFWDCESLKNIVLPRSLRIIASGAFSGCGIEEIDFRKVQLPDDEVLLFEEALFSHSSIKKVDLSGIDVGLSNRVFAFCKYLEEVSLPNPDFNSGRLMPYTFQECHKLKTVQGLEQYWAIGEYAFWKCTGLKQLSIPDSIAHIEDMAFEGAGIQILHVGKGLKLCGQKSFFYCEDLVTAIFEDCQSKVVFEDFIFANCVRLETASLPLGLEYLSEGMFSNCESLQTLVLPASIAGIDPIAFTGCKSLSCIVRADGDCWQADTFLDRAFAGLPLSQDSKKVLGLI